VYAQLIDDTLGKTLAAASSAKLAGKSVLVKSKEVGKAIAEQAKAKKISKIVFDRAGYIYTGKIKALAEGAREGGLKF
jgi:large subunit ribosomal protein L18